MNSCITRILLVAAGLLIQQLWLVAVAQEVRPDMAVGRVPGPQAPAGAWGTPVTSSQEIRSWDGLEKTGTVITQPGRADGLGKPALGGERRPLYRLRKSDVVEVAFTFSPEFDQSVSVLPDGYMQLKGLGNVYAEGETLPELQTAIQKAYGATLHDPEVTLTLKDFDKPYFTASGEVGRPGKYELRSDTTIIEAVAIAGGFTQQARHSEVVLFHRISDDRMEPHVVNLKKMLNSRKLDEEVRLRPGDILFVPQSTVSKVRKYVPVPGLGMYVNGSQF